MNKEEFIEELKKIGIDVNDNQLDLLDKYYKLLIDWNEKINLTGITDENDVYLKHFYDSLTLIKGVDLTKDISLCDVGSGAGFPGIVLKIIFPNLKITLIDSLQKRVNFLNLVIKELDLNGIEALHYRMEDFSRENEEKYDYITARAVANLSVISEISVRALKVNGHMVFMKGNCDEELEEFMKHNKKLGLVLDDIYRFNLPFEDSNRTLIDLVKVKKTSKIYPRRVDIIKKEVKR